MYIYRKYTHPHHWCSKDPRIRMKGIHYSVGPSLPHYNTRM